MLRVVDEVAGMSRLPTGEFTKTEAVSTMW